MEKKSASNRYYEIVLEWFKQQILSGELKEGDGIPSERELAAKFGVSRVPVREALRILEYIGIISSGSDGMVLQKIDAQLLNPKVNFASEITRETLENLFEVRLILESSAAHFAALRRTDEDVRKMQEAVRKLADAIENPDGNVEALVQASQAFHFQVVEAAGNPVLANIYQSLYELLEVSKKNTMSVDYVSDASLLDHEAILYKIETGNAEDAGKYMKYHLTRTLDKLVNQAKPKENEN